MSATRCLTTVDRCKAYRQKATLLIFKDNFLETAYPFLIARDTHPPAS
jgi:hypothetical protein